MTTLVGVVVGVPLLAVLLSIWFLVEAKWLIESKRRALARELPRLLADDEAKARELLNRPLFAPPEGGDAGPTLNERISWPDRPGTLVSASCDATLKKAGAAWPSLKPTEIESCDTSWLAELRRFSRWSLIAGPRSALPVGPRKDFAFPEFMDLQQAVKLHLLFATDREQAAQDVRHFARLFMTQEYLVFAMVGFAVLSLEQRFWEHAGKVWSAPPLTQSELEFLRAHFRTAIFALNPLADPRLTASVLDASPNYRRCFLVTEQAFAGRRTEFPEAAGHSFENARWELAHRWEQERGALPEVLSSLGQHGAALVKRLDPARYWKVMDELVAADALPAEHRWNTRQSEFLNRVSSRA